MLPQWYISTPLGTTLACPFVIHISERRGRREIFATIATGAGLWLLLRFLGEVSTGVAGLLASLGAALGMASLLLLFVRACVSRGETYRGVLRTFFAGALFPCCWVGIGYALLWTVRSRPVVNDHLLYSFDGTLGFQPSFVLGRFLQHHRLLLHVLIFVYESTVVPAALLYGAHRVQAKAPIRLISLWASAMLVGYLIYNVFPAIGPVYAFPGSFPWHAGALTAPVQPVWTASTAPRNCMPSIHLTVALLIWWNSRGRSWWARLAAALFVVSTVMATLGLGEHYLADLVVAVPFALAFQAMWTTSLPLRRIERLSTIVVTSTVCIAWLLCLRFAPTLFLRWWAMPWIAIGATLLLCLGLHYRLIHAGEGEKSVPLLLRATASAPQS